MLEWLGIIALALFALPYVVGPIAVYAAMTRRPRFEVSTPDAAPESSRRYVEQQLEQLRQLDFSPLGWFRYQESPQAVATVAFAERRDLHAMALAAELVASGPGGRRIQLLELCTTFTDGHEVLTSNNDDLMAPPALRHKTVLQLPAVRSVDHLERIHPKLVAHVAAQRPDATPRDLPPHGVGDAPSHELLAELRDAFARENRALVSAGYMRRVDRGGEEAYRLTAKGALILTWRQLWPLSRLLKRARCRRAHALLEQLGEPGDLAASRG